MTRGDSASDPFGPSGGLREAADGGPLSVAEGGPAAAECAAEPCAVAAQARSRAMLEAFLSAIDRLEGVLDHETQMLGQNRPIALNDFNHRKSHGLLELNRAMIACRALDAAAFDGAARAPLARLRIKLESNLAGLQTHLAAVGEIAATIARAIQDHESDGTYTAKRSARGEG